MTGFDFFVDLTVTGTVLGLDDTSELPAVEAVFGPGWSPDPNSWSHNSGLIEFGWHCHKGIWAVQYFGAQVHRLPWLTRDREVEPALVERYGDFPHRVDVDDLRAAVARSGGSLVEVPYHDEDYVDYWSPVTRMGVLAERGTRTVIKLLGRSGGEGSHTFAGQWRKFHQWVRYLVTATEVERKEWYDKHEPAADRADWWWSLARAALAVGGPPVVDRRRLKLDVLRDAVARGALPADEVLLAEVELFVAAAMDDDPLGPVDDHVRRWLAPPPAPLPRDVRVARRLRDEAHRIGTALPWLTDPELVAEVRAWQETKALLLAG